MGLTGVEVVADKSNKRAMVIIRFYGNWQVPPLLDGSGRHLGCFSYHEQGREKRGPIAAIRLGA